MGRFFDTTFRMEVNDMKKTEPDIVYEQEGFPDEPQVDTVWVLDGRGRMVTMEVADDVGDT